MLGAGKEFALYVFETDQWKLVPLEAPPNTAAVWAEWDGGSIFKVNNLDYGTEYKFGYLVAGEGEADDKLDDETGLLQTVEFETEDVPEPVGLNNTTMNSLAASENSGTVTLSWTISQESAVGAIFVQYLSDSGDAWTTLKNSEITRYEENPSGEREVDFSFTVYPFSQFRLIFEDGGFWYYSGAVS